MTVDPDVIVAGIDDTYNQSPYTNNYVGEAEVKVGTFNGGANKSRAFFHFNLAPWNGKVINSATMYAVETHSYSCAARPMSLYRVTTGWGTISTFPGPALGERIGGDNFAVGYSSACPGQWAGFDISGAVRNWTNGTWPVNNGLAFVADNENDTYGWKKFCSANGGAAGCNASTVPQIQITWSNPATVPTCAATGQTATVNPNGSVAVRWTPAPNTTSCNGGSGITGYYVNYYEPSGAGGSTYCAGATCAATTIPNLVRGRQYHFAIYTNNAVGYNPNPAWTGYVTITAVPAAPTGAAANAGKTSAYVWWTPPADPGTSPIDQYAVWAYNPANGAFLEYRACTAPCTGLTLNVAGMAPGQQYGFYVYAHNASGWSAASATTSIVTLTNTPLPNPVELPTAWAGDASAYLRWNPPIANDAAPIEAYVLGAYNPAGTLIGSITCNLTGSTAPCPGLDWVWNGTNNPGAGLTNGTAYKFIVFARNAAGYGTATGLTNPATPSPSSLFPPRSAMVNAGNSEAVIQWTAPAAGGATITGYVIQRFGSNGGYIDDRTVTADRLGLLWSGLTNALSYTFRVYTISGNGNTPIPTFTNAAIPDGNIISRLLLPTSPVAQDQQNRTSTVTWAPPALAVPASLGILATTYTVRAFTFDTQGDCVVPTNLSAQAVQPTTGQPNATVTDLKNGTSYCFTVEATNLIVLNSGQSPASNTVIPAGAPFAPIDVEGTRDDQKAKLTWLPPAAREDGTPGDNGRPITRYDVQILDRNEMILGTRENVSSGQFIEQLTNGTPYRFRVLAVNSIGISDPSTPSNEVIPAGRPFPPTEAAAVLSGDQAVIVSWVPPAAQGGVPGDNGEEIYLYRVITSPRCTTCVGTGTSGTSTTVTGLRPGTVYSFTVVARNEIGESNPSNATNSVAIPAPDGAPDEPVFLSATTPRSGEASLTWSQPDANGSPILDYTVTSEPAGRVITTTTNTATMTGLADGTTYRFAVVARNAIGIGPAGYSDTVTPAAPPGSPAPVDAIAGDGSVALTWTATPGGIYSVTTYDSIGLVSPAPSVQITGSSAVVSGLASGKKYFAVTSTNSAGQTNTAFSLTVIPYNRAEADAWMTGSLVDFTALRQQAAEPYDWTSSGCSFPIDVYWRQRFELACDRHDFGYRNYGNGLRMQSDEPTRAWIDEILRDDLLDFCYSLSAVESPECYARVDTYYGAVRNFGRPAFYG